MMNLFLLLVIQNFEIINSISSMNIHLNLQNLQNDFLNNENLAQP